MRRSDAANPCCAATGCANSVVASVGKWVRNVDTFYWFLRDTLQTRVNSYYLGFHRPGIWQHWACAGSQVQLVPKEPICLPSPRRPFSTQSECVTRKCRKVLEILTDEINVSFVRRRISRTLSFAVVSGSRDRASNGKSRKFSYLPHNSEDCSTKNQK